MEVLPEKKEVERPWRANMKVVTTNHPKEAEVVKQPAYDREEIRKFMLAKKKREKDEKEKKEKDGILRQEMIKQRLSELEKLQKHITKTEISAPPANKFLKVRYIFC